MQTAQRTSVSRAFSYRRRRLGGARDGRQRSRASDSASGFRDSTSGSGRWGTCAAWNERCDYWATANSRPWLTCCASDRTVCKCNLWAQNCKCASRLLGRRRWDEVVVTHTIRLRLRTSATGNGCLLIFIFLLFLFTFLHLLLWFFFFFYHFNAYFCHFEFLISSHYTPISIASVRKTVAYSGRCPNESTPSWKCNKV